MHVVGMGLLTDPQISGPGADLQPVVRRSPVIVGPHLPGEKDGDIRPQLPTQGGGGDDPQGVVGPRKPPHRQGKGEKFPVVVGVGKQGHGLNVAAEQDLVHKLAPLM